MNFILLQRRFDASCILRFRPSPISPQLCPFDNIKVCSKAVRGSEERINEPARMRGEPYLAV